MRKPKHIDTWKGIATPEPDNTMLNDAEARFSLLEIDDG